MSLHSKEKVYTKRPLCVVYYGVDFGFDGRQGGLNVDPFFFLALSVKTILKGYNREL